MESRGHHDRLASRAFSKSGYYLLQGRLDKGEDKDTISVVFDCGELGFGPIAAHGHADALSFTMRAFGEDILVDPGTYDYFTYPVWREYFRGTRAHNTVVVDDRDQSEMLGAFLWGQRATSRCLRWEPTPNGGTVTGEHDGYQALSEGVSHRRTITLDGSRGEVRLLDELTGSGQHSATFCLHIAESYSCKKTLGHSHQFTNGIYGATIDIDTQLRAEVLRGSENPIAGWVSSSYHRKTPACTLLGRCNWQDHLKLETRIAIRRLQYSGDRQPKEKEERI
jgi:hypothetical protein